MSGSPRVNVLMCTYGRICPETTFSLLALVLKNKDKILDLKYKTYYHVDHARTLLTKETLGEGEATHVLWLDADMVWPEDLLGRLLAHGKPVVGANYFIKTPPFDCVAGDFVSPDERRVRRLRRLQGGCLRVGALGLGATLIETSVLRGMRNHFGDEKWFWCEGGGEDLWFFDRCRKMGVPVYLDGGLICGHISEYMVTERHWMAAREQCPPTDMVPAWCDFADLYAEAVQALPEDGVVVEVGSFLGRSAICMARLLKYSGKVFKFYCVDHFKGSDDDHHRRIVAECGGNFRHKFEANLKEHGVFELVNVVEGDSAASADKFDDQSCDFVFIDAEHDTESVIRDINAWLPKVKPGGTLAGHDMDWDSVKKAVDALLPAAVPHGKSWVWRKPS